MAEPRATTIVFVAKLRSATSFNPNGLNVLPLFDEKFTFDKSDSIKYNISFRPLFFIDQYGKLRGVNNLHKTNQNLLFVGTAHTDRYLISNIIVSWCKKNKINTNTYYFIPGLMVFFFKKIFDKSFSGFNYNSLSVKPLSIEQLLQLYKTATIILDIHHPDQSGLTMRTFEALGAGKKLITTNAFIKEYFFFNENNILIIERNQTEFNYDFFLSPVKFYDNEMYSKMSIEGWLNEIFFSSDGDFWINS